MKWLNFKFFKRIGFYVSLISAICLVLANVSYTNGFTGNLLEYNINNVMPVTLIGVCGFVLLLLFKPTSNYAPLVLWGGAFVSLLVYVQNIYMYFTGIFYNGISAEAFALIDSAVLTSTLLFAIAFIFANVAMYTKHSVEEVEPNEKA